MDADDEQAELVTPPPFLLFAIPCPAGLAWPTVNLALIADDCAAGSAFNPIPSAVPQVADVSRASAFRQGLTHLRPLCPSSSDMSAQSRLET